MAEVENVLVEGLMVIIQLQSIRFGNAGSEGNYDTIRSVFGNQLEVFQKDRGNWKPHTLPVET